MPANRRTNAFIAKAQSLGAALLYAPLLSTDPLTNLGTVPLGAGALVNGATLASPGLFEDAPAVVLDGSNDYIDAGWPTRANLAPDPFMAHPTTLYESGAAGVTLSGAEKTLPTRFGGVVGKVLKIIIDGSIVNQNAQTRAVSTGSSAFTVPELKPNACGIYVWLGKGETITVDWNERTAADGFVAVTTKTITGTGDWQWVSIVRTFAAGNTKARIRFGNNNTVTKVAATFYVLAPVVEVERATEIPEGEQFPLPAQIGEGVAGWSATANESASYIGPFASGTTRTYVLALEPQAGGVNHGLFAGSISNSKTWALWLSEAGALTWRVGNGTGLGEKTVFPAGSVVAGTTYIVALKYDSVANTVQAFLNGVAGAVLTGVSAEHFSAFLSLYLSSVAFGAFKGQMLPFAVFPSALGEAQIQELTHLLEGKFPTVPAAAVVSEPVDDALFVKLTNADGRQGRWSGIEAEAKDIATGISYSNSAPGGHRSAGLTLLRDPRLNYPDLNFIDDIVIYGRTKPLGRNAFEGMNVQFPSQVTDSESISVNAVGNQELLNENEAWKALYVDLGFSNWKEVGRARKEVIAAAGFPQGRIQLSTGEEGLVWDVPNQALGGDLCEAFYAAAAACPVAAFAYTGRRVKDWTKFEGPTMSFSEAETLGEGPAPITLTLDGFPHSGSVLISSGKAWRYAMVRAYNFIAGTPEAGTQQAYSELAMYGNTGIPTREIPGHLPGVYGHDVLGHIVSTGAPDLNYKVGGNGSIIPNTSFVIPDFAPTEGGKPSDAIEKLNAYFLNNWGVWDDKEFFWKPWNPEDLTWQVSLAGGAQWSPVGRQAPTEINGLIVEYTDAEGIARTAGPPGSGSDYESPLLANSDPSNPYTRRGRRRWAKLSVGFPLAYPTTAFQVGSIVLAESMLPQRSGSLTIRPRGAGHIPSVTHPTMGQLPIWPFRSGDHAVLMDWPVPEPLRVSAVDVNVDGKSLTAQLDSGAARLTAILERSGSRISA